ncbi:MAG: hypothetical protein J07HQX50_02248, partial [Haloquadratum sp. J07HQX50]
GLVSECQNCGYENHAGKNIGLRYFHRTQTGAERAHSGRVPEQRNVEYEW